MLHTHTHTHTHTHMYMYRGEEGDGERKIHNYTNIQGTYRVHIGREREGQREKIYAITQILIEYTSYT